MTTPHAGRSLALKLESTSCTNNLAKSADVNVCMCMHVCVCVRHVVCGLLRFAQGVLYVCVCVCVCCFVGTVISDIMGGEYVWIVCVDYVWGSCVGLCVEIMREHHVQIVCSCSETRFLQNMFRNQPVVIRCLHAVDGRTAARAQAHTDIAFIYGSSACGSLPALRPCYRVPPVCMFRCFRRWLTVVNPLSNSLPSS